MYVIFTGELLQLFFDTVYFATAFTNDDTRLRSMDGYNQFIEGTFDNDFRNATLVDTGIQVGTDLVVLDQSVGLYFLVAVPVTVPTTDDTEPVTDWICFLTHYFNLKI